MTSLFIVNSHVSGRKHLARFQKLKAAWEGRFLTHWHASSSLPSRIKALGSEKWKWQMTSLHFSYLESGLGSDLKKAQTMLSKYELMEKLSLLELAIWKQQIVGHVFLSVQEAREYWVLEEGFDFKEYFFQRRVTSGVAVIVPIVLSFLANKSAL
jgi:hypothetical protein